MRHRRQRQRLCPSRSRRNSHSGCSCGGLSCEARRQFTARLGHCAGTERNPRHRVEPEQQSPPRVRCECPRSPQARACQVPRPGAGVRSATPTPSNRASQEQLVAATDALAAPGCRRRQAGPAQRSRTGASFDSKALAASRAAMAHAAEPRLGQDTTLPNQIVTTQRHRDLLASSFGPTGPLRSRPPTNRGCGRVTQRLRAPIVGRQCDPGNPPRHGGHPSLLIRNSAAHRSWDTV